MLFDTHCHLDTAKFDADRAAVLARALGAGVGLILNPAYDLESSRRATALAAQATPANPLQIVAAVGVHPTSTAEFTPETLAQLRDLAGNAPGRVVAIGEIGLDYHWKTVPPDAQRAAFLAQLELARELDLPVIIHCREAEDDVLTILEAHWRGRPLVMHSFAGDQGHLARALACGFHIGVSGPVTYPNAARTRDIVRTVPRDKLLIETDAPFLTPQRHRGKRNEPAYVRLVAEKIADVREVMLDDVARFTAGKWAAAV